MIDRIKSYADKYDMLPRGGLVLAAVSGGSDSMCLLDILCRLSDWYGFKVSAMHYNHRLRGDESDRDERFVLSFCSEHGIDFHAGSGDVGGYAKKNGLGIEEAARIMRYAFFKETFEKEGALRIATAHNADDNAETVILNLTRGAGLRGLCGIPPVRGKIVRPLLSVTRAEIEGYLIERGIPHIEDSTNSDDNYTRNRIRHTVIPILSEINPNFSKSATKSAELLRRDDEYLQRLADDFISSCGHRGRADAETLAELPFPVASRAVRSLTGSSLSSCHVEAVLRLCSAGGPSDKVCLPDMTVSREYGDIVFGADISHPEFLPVEIEPGKMAEIREAGLKISCENGVCGDKIHKSLTTFLFKKSELCGKIIVRPRFSGDFISIFGRGGSKSLKKLFIEEHIPAGKRGVVPVISDSRGVLAVYGLGADKRAFPSFGDPVLKITFEEIV